MNDIEKLAQRTKIKKLHKAIKKTKGTIKKIENEEPPKNKHQQRRQNKKITKNIDKKIREGFENLIHFIKSLE